MNETARSVLGTQLWLSVESLNKSQKRISWSTTLINSWRARGYKVPRIEDTCTMQNLDLVFNVPKTVQLLQEGNRF